MAQMELAQKTSVKHCIAIVVLVAATCVIFSDMLHHAFLTNWDDELYVTGNEAAHGFSWEHIKSAFRDFFAGNYAPVQILSYMLDYEMWGKWAGGYKLVNLLYHLLSGILFYTILVRFFKISAVAAFCAAFIFLNHPVQVESVAWISQRKTVLSGFFFLLSLGAYFQYTENKIAKGNLWLTGAIATYAISLLSKSTTVVLLPILLLYEWLFTGKVKLLNKLPFLVATIIMVVVTMISQSPENHGGIEKYHGGSPYSTFLTMLTVLPRYLYLVFWPLKLSAAYSPTIYTGINLIVASAALFWVLLGALALFLARTRPHIAFWYLLFFLGLLPVSQIVPIATIMNDRYLYIPLMGLAGCAAYLVQNVLQLPERYARNTAAVLILTVLCAMAPITAKQVTVWRSSVNLWQTAAERYPHSPEAWTGLGNAFQKDNKIGAALSAYLQSIILKPDNDISLNNAALTYLTLGKPYKAEEYAQRLLNVNKSAVSRTTLAMIYFARGEFDRAEQQAKLALAKDPQLETALTLMGSIATEQGNYAEAEKYLMRSLTLHGSIAPILIAMATLEGAQHNDEKASRLLIRALEAGYREYKPLLNNKHLERVLSRPEIRTIINHFMPGTFL